MAAFLDFKMATIQNLILLITRKLNMTEREKSKVLGVWESNETTFGIPTWPPSWIFKMAAIQILILLITRKLKVIETQTQMLYLGFWCQQIPWDYFQNSKMAAILNFNYMICTAEVLFNKFLCQNLF